MAFDKQLADDLRMVTASEAGISEKRMFGGIGFLIHGNLAVSASAHGGLLLRVNPEGGCPEFRRTSVAAR